MLKEVSIRKILNEVKTNCYSPIKHYHVIYSVMTICFNLKRPSSGHHYKNFKNFKISANYACSMESHMTYKGYTI